MASTKHYGVVLLLILLAGCASLDRAPTTEQYLSSATAAYVAASKTLAAAVKSGALSVSSIDYARAYSALTQADDVLTGAEAIYAQSIAARLDNPERATDLEFEALAQANVALSILNAIEPMLAKYGDQ